MGKNLEKIIINNIYYAIIIKNEYKIKGMDFITDPQNSIQLAIMNHPKGHCIKPHYHNKISREILNTQEVIYIKNGKVKINFYDKDNHSIATSKILQSGDLVLLIDGGHGFEILEDTDMIEIKQGPYLGDMDKVRFDG